MKNMVFLRNKHPPVFPITKKSEFEMKMVQKKEYLLKVEKRLKTENPKTRFG